MTIRSALNGTLIVVAVVAASSSLVNAQWSIGAPGRREPQPGKHRYVMLVFANPIPGKEVEFNEWYTNTHMGDLVQLPGWMGAQRFRIITNVMPRPSMAGYSHGYLIIWDLEETEANTALARMTAAIAGGKSRLGAAFNYTPGAGANGTFRNDGTTRDTAGWERSNATRPLRQQDPPPKSVHSDGICESVAGQRSRFRQRRGGEYAEGVAASRLDGGSAIPDGRYARAGAKCEAEVLNHLGDGGK